MVDVSEETWFTKSMNTDTTTEHPYLVSSTGMLHRQGCGTLTVCRSAVQYVSPDCAALVEWRCKTCRPMPLAQPFTPGARPTAAERTAQADQAAAERYAASKAAAAAAWTPEADAAVLAFAANECQSTHDTMMALAPEGANTFARLRQLKATR
jgi:predicted RNA-binding Zn-ribbon protein involved in translation (DUF1610 family)